MICVYSPDITDYTTLGLGVLTPISCTITEKAGGSYELTLVHPLDGTGRWKWLQPGFIIKAPVPALQIESGTSGSDVDVYKAKSSGVPVRSKPAVPSTITYATWVEGNMYSVGDKVTYSGKNYQCTAHMSTIQSYQTPAYLTSCWTQIASQVSGGEVLYKLSANEEMYRVSTYSAYWLYVQTADGTQGYVQISSITFVRSETVTPVAPREVREQLFRVYNIKTDSERGQVTVTAKHVSYDFAGDLLSTCVLSEVTAATALSRVKNALRMPQEFTLATDIDDSEGTYTGTLTYSNLINALLDPDTGIVPGFKARFVRDNWDLFVYLNEERDRGYRLSYGVNLKGVTWTRDTGDIITRVMPVAKNSDGTDLLLDELYVDSSVIDSYPVVMMEKLQVSGTVGADDGQGGTWTTSTLQEFMRSEAAKRYSADKCDQVKTTITVKFQMLGDTAEYSAYKALERLYLYDTVLIDYPDLGLTQSVQVSAYEWDAVNGRYNSITLGDVFDYSGGIAGFELKNGTIKISKLASDTIDQLKGDVNGGS